MLKSESIVVHTSIRECRSFESEFPSLEKRGEGRFFGGMKAGIIRRTLVPVHSETFS